MNKQRHRRHEIARITLRHVREEAIFRRGRGYYYPSCRGNRREDCRLRPAWNVRYSYKSLSVRGGGQSMYWCDVCLPARYREVADSMLRGNEKARILQGEAMEAVALQPSRKPTDTTVIPWHLL